VVVFSPELKECVADPPSVFLSQGHLQDTLSGPEGDLVDDLGLVFNASDLPHIVVGLPFLSFLWIWAMKALYMWGLTSRHGLTS
jgi:hypothetical protein